MSKVAFYTTCGMKPDSLRTSPGAKACRHGLSEFLVRGESVPAETLSPGLRRLHRRRSSDLAGNQPMSVAPEIYAQVTNVSIEALALDTDDISPMACLQRDLGADSLDLLEIIFRLEHAFGIEIPRGELFPDSTSGSDQNWCRTAN